MGIERGPNFSSLPPERESKLESEPIPSFAQRPIEKSDLVQSAEDNKEDEKLAAEIGTINNRPQGEKTERPVFNVEGVKDKDKLTYADVKEYVKSDRLELVQVAKKVGDVLGLPLTPEQAQALVYRRMTGLWEISIRASLQQEKLVGDKMYDLRQEQDRLRLENSSLWRKWFPDKGKEVRIEEIEREREELGSDKNKRAKLESGRTYEVHELTHFRAIVRRYPAADAILLYTDEQDQKRALRLNKIQLELAQRGVFYKGEPTDNRFDEKSRNKTYDQAAYPQSPLQFYQEHMSEWITTSPTEARNMLDEIIQERINK